MFSGLIFGAFPYFDEDVYQANVHDYSIQGSVNLTANLRFEILNFAKFDLEVQIVPFLLGGGISWYQSTAMEEFCIWIHSDLEMISVETTLTKNIAQCSNNLKTTVDKADSWADLASTISFQKGLLLLEDVQCEYDEVNGPNRQKIDMFSGTLPPHLKVNRVLGSTCIKEGPRSQIFRSTEDIEGDEEYYEY